jgi:hypothetical protein
MQTLTHNILWQVSLSNGETFFEDKGKFKEIPGLSSPWQRLIAYISRNHLEITSLSLYTRDGQTFNLPSAGNNPKFQAFAKLQKPLDYEMCRCGARNVAQVENGVVKQVESNGFSELFTIAKAIYPTGTLQLWVDERNPKNCWTLFEGYSK